MGERTTERAGAAERPQGSGAAAPARGGRMSRQRKTAAVLRLLRGEDLARRYRCDTGDLARGVPGRRRGRPDDSPQQRRDTRERAAEGAARRDAARARIAGAEDHEPGGGPPFGPPQVEAMSRTISRSSGKPYGLALV